MGVNKLASKAFYSLTENNEDNNKETIIALENFNAYLKKLAANISQNPIAQNMFFDWLFKSRINSKRDYEVYLKMNLVGASQSFDRLVYGLENTDKRPHSFHVLNPVENTKINEITKKVISNYICDLKPFIRHFDKDQDYTWLWFNTNIHVSNFYYDLAVNSFWNGMPGAHLEQASILSSSTTFIIRQSIEYKIKRILGIESIKIDGNPDLRSMTKFFAAIKANNEFYHLRNIDFGLIKKIHEWTHSHIHGGIRPEPWKIEIALDYLKTLFYIGTTINPNQKSIYAAVEVKKQDLNALKLHTADTITRLTKMPIEIQWLSGPEVAII